MLSDLSLMKTTLLHRSRLLPDIATPRSARNTPTLGHTLLELDALKRNLALLNIAKADPSKAYAVAVITHTLSGMVSEMGRTDFEARGGCYLTQKNIPNGGIAWHQANSDIRNLHPTTSLETDLIEAGVVPSVQQCCSKRISSGELGKNSEPVQGLVMGHLSGLAVLQPRGVVVLVDATHITNKSGWPLFTVMVRDEHGVRCACAHFVASNQMAELISGALTTITKWCQGLPHLCYSSTDDNAAKQSAVKKAFPGILAGELEVSHFLCTVHSMRTMDRKLKAKQYAAPKKHLLSTMFGRTTKPECAAAFQPALEASSDAEISTWLEKEWLHLATNGLCMLGSIAPYSCRQLLLIQWMPGIVALNTALARVRNPTTPLRGAISPSMRKLPN